MSQKDRERLQHITANTEKPALTNIPASYSSSSPTIVVPHTDPHAAEAAIHGFQPFATDPEKQARYVAYLQSQASPGSQLLIKPRSGQSVDDFNKELSDYAKSALIFKPMSGAMAGMFTSATIIETGPKVHEGLFIPSAEKIADESKSSDSPPEKLEDTSAKAHAARMGMYGPLTREVTKWLPAKLLCKRFGVKDPDPGPENIADQAPASASSWTPEAALASSVSGTKSDLDKATETASSRRDGPRDLTNIGLGGDENQGRDTLTYERPAMDIFKAIFASDDEDSGDEQDHNALAGPSGELEKAAPLSQPTTSVAATPITREPAAEKTPDRAEKIDMATFKPTFIPRSTKDDKQKESRKKKKKQSSSKAVLVSFEVDEGGEGGDLEGSKKKKRKGRKQNHEDEEGMWVEKPPPEVKTFPKLPIATVEEEFRSSEVVGPPRERKRAIDFM
jgi:G patch domain-containing protein 1